MASTRVYLHIGLGKAGSSAIQQFLYANAAVLAANKFCYPIYRVGNSHQILAHKWGGWLSEEGVKRFGPDEAWSDLCKQIKSSKQTFIISSERFTGATFDAQDVPEFVAQMFKGLGTKIVVYLRPQDDLAESEYKQRVYSGLRISFEQFVKKLPPYFDYQALLARWASAFGTKNIVVRRYQATNLASDFLDAVGIPSNLPFVAKESRVQPSISALSAQLILALHLNNQEPDDRWRIDKIRALTDSDTGCFMTDQIREKIREQFRESNKAVALTYLGEPELFRESQPKKSGAVETPQRRIIDQQTMHRTQMPTRADLSHL